jgi:hypothetical protein
METMKFDVTMRADSVRALKNLSRELSYRGEMSCTWLDLVRQGADLVLGTSREELLTRIKTTKLKKINLKGDDK